MQWNDWYDLLQNYITRHTVVCHEAQEKRET